MSRLIALFILVGLLCTVEIDARKKNCSQCKAEMQSYFRSLFTKRTNPTELTDNLGELCSDPNFSLQGEYCSGVSDVIAMSTDATGVCSLLQLCPSDWEWNDTSEICDLDACVSTSALCANICSCTKECTPECRQCFTDVGNRCADCFKE